ncbi:GNAT family N-acetyltransferase [Algoriphagus sp. A40]|nr:GNAT family N-acetyltransferase [Algoriphagus sp. A40]
MQIRQENPGDYEAVFEVVEKAFAAEEFSDQTEQFLVERLRKSDAFVPELSLVAELGDKIVGHILLTKLRLVNDQTKFESLALAPVSVLPEYQRKGIGGMLIEYSHQRAKELGFKSVVVLGHEKYYPKFGYQQADLFGIELPFDVPKENCMVIELVENGLTGLKGMVEYPKEFYE